MTSVNWQQSLAMLDANLKHVATEWLRQAARNSATTNVQLNDEFRQTFLQISNDRWNENLSLAWNWFYTNGPVNWLILIFFCFFLFIFINGLVWMPLIRLSKVNHNLTNCILLFLLPRLPLLDIRLQLVPFHLFQFLMLVVVWSHLFDKFDRLVKVN